MEIRLWSMGRTPCGIEPRLRGAFDAEKVDTPGRTRIKEPDEAAHRYRKLCSPDLCTFIHPRSALHSAVRIRSFSMFDIEVNPIAVGTNFKFHVMARVSRI